MKSLGRTDCYIVLPCSLLMLYRLNLGFPMTPYYHLFLHPMGRLHLHPGLRRPPNFHSGHTTPSSSSAPRVKTNAFAPMLCFSPRISYFFTSSIHSFTSTLYPSPTTAAIYYSDRRPDLYLLPLLLISWILPLRVYWLVLRLRHHVKLYSTLTAYPLVHRLAMSALSHTDNLSFYGFIGWFALRPGQLRHFVPTR